MTLIFSGIVKEKTEKHLVVETATGIHRIALNRIVELSGAPGINKFESVIGKAACVLTIDGKFWLRIMGNGDEKL